MLSTQCLALAIIVAAMPGQVIIPNRREEDIPVFLRHSAKYKVSPAEARTLLRRFVAENESDERAESVGTAFQLDAVVNGEYLFVNGFNSDRKAKLVLYGYRVDVTSGRVRKVDPKTAGREWGGYPKIWFHDLPKYKPPEM